MQTARQIQVKPLESLTVEIKMKGTSFVLGVLFQLKPFIPLAVQSYDEQKKRWVKTVIIWDGRSEGVECMDEEKFQWITPIRELGNSKLWDKID